MKSLHLLPLLLFAIPATLRAQTQTYRYDGYVDTVWGNFALYDWVRPGMPSHATIMLNGTTPIGFTADYDATDGNNYSTTIDFYSWHTLDIRNSASGDGVELDGVEPVNDTGASLFLTDPSGKAIGSNGIVNYKPSVWPGISWRQDSTYGYWGGYTASVPLVQTEILKVQAKSAVPSGVFYDVNASGSAGTYLTATAPGQFVSYTVPVTAGYYRLRVGVNSNKDKGMFQLSIDGAKQGARQDEYSATSVFGLRDLGTVAFFDDCIGICIGQTFMNKAFTFTVTGKNSNSTGYRLRFDWIDLIPIPTTGLETEWLKVQALTPPPAGTASAQWFGKFDAAAASNGAGTYFNANAPGQFITYTVPVIPSGIYRVVAGIQTKPNKGKFQLAINGVKQGFVQDGYSTTTAYGTRDLGTASLGGNEAFTFTVTGKNASSTGYTLAFDYISLIPWDRLEAEWLTILRRSAVPTGVFSAAAASGGAGVYFNATAPGQSITYSLAVPDGATYLHIGMQTKPTKGTFRVAVDGVDQGVEIDGYSPTTGYEELVSIRDCSPGAHELTFTVTGKNPSSTGYTLAFDYFRVESYASG